MTDTSTATEESKAFPDVKGCILLMIVGWVAIIPIIALVTVVGVLVFPSMEGERSLLLDSSYMVSIFLLLAIGLKRERSSVREILALRKFPGWMIGHLVLIAFPLSIIVSEIDNLVQEVFPAPAFLASYVVSLLVFNSWKEFLERFFILSIMAPFTEELLFRGLFQHGLVKNRGTMKGIFYASLFFGIFHLIPWQALGAFLIGLMLGFLVLKTGSIFPAIMAHALLNLLPLVLIHIQDVVPIPGYNLLNNQLHHIPPLVLGPSAVLLGVSLFLLTRHAR